MNVRNILSNIEQQLVGLEDYPSSMYEDEWRHKVAAALELIRLAHRHAPLQSERTKGIDADHRYDALKEKADELVEVICHAAPTGWAAAGDLVGASEWEKEAVKAVDAYEAAAK